VVLAIYFAFLSILIGSLIASTQNFSKHHAFLEAKALSIRAASIHDSIASNARAASLSFSIGNCTVAGTSASCRVGEQAASAMMLGALNASSRLQKT